MASRSFPPHSRRSLAHLLRNGATVEAGDAGTLRLAHVLARLGLVHLATKRYIRCAHRVDEDYLDVIDPGCEGRVEVEMAPADCPICGRPIEYPGIAKEIFVEMVVDLNLAGIAAYLYATLDGAGGVEALAPLNAYAVRVELEGGDAVVVYVADALGARWRSPGPDGRLVHLAVTAGTTVHPETLVAPAISLVDWLVHDGVWLVAQFQRMAKQAQIAHRTVDGDAPRNEERMTARVAGTQLDIRIDGCGAEGYPVEFSLGGVRHFQGFAPTELPSVTPGSGNRQLFAWLCSDPHLVAAWQVACEAPPPLHLRLRLEAPELHALPWEAMGAPVDGAWVSVAAADATPFSRYLALSGRPRRAITQRPVRVLVAVAAPMDLAEHGMAAIDRRSEWENLQAVLPQSTSAAHYLSGPCTLAAIEQRLREGVHCLHLVAHGGFDADGAFLMLEDEYHRMMPVSGLAFAEIVARVTAGGTTALRLVFLDACHSAAHGQSVTMRNLAVELIHAGVPAVLAMQGAVDVATSRRFAHAFYRQLFEHGIVDLAANQARATLLARLLPGSGIPALYMRLLDSCLFEGPLENYQFRRIDAETQRLAAEKQR